MTLGPNQFRRHALEFASVLEEEIGLREKAKDPPQVTKRGRRPRLEQRYKSKHENPLNVNSCIKEKKIRQFKCSRCGKWGHKSSSYICVFKRMRVRMNR